MSVKAHSHIKIKNFVLIQYNKKLYCPVIPVQVNIRLRVHCAIEQVQDISY